MTFDGKLEGVTKDVFRNVYLVTFATPELPTLSDLADRFLTITAKIKRKARTLDANAYAWLLIGKMADVLRTDKDAIYQKAIFDYGQLAEDSKGASMIMVKEGSQIHSQMGKEHLYPKFLGTVTVEGYRMDEYIIYRGSSSYDTREMAIFIDGIVQDAKDLGIDTIPIVDIERAKRKWRLSG